MSRDLIHVSANNIYKLRLDDISKIKFRISDSRNREWKI